MKPITATYINLDSHTPRPSPQTNIMPPRETTCHVSPQPRSTRLIVFWTATEKLRVEKLFHACWATVRGRCDTSFFGLTKIRETAQVRNHRFESPPGYGKRLELCSCLESPSDVNKKTPLDDSKLLSRRKIETLSLTSFELRQAKTTLFALQHPTGTLGYGIAGFQHHTFNLQRQRTKI